MSQAAAEKMQDANYVFNSDFIPSLPKSDVYSWCLYHQLQLFSISPVA